VNGHPSSFADALNATCDRLRQAMHADGFWEGRLSSSALSTATALSALALANDPGDADRLRCGVAWLAGNQNADGGWGDTADSPSNLATTLLAIAAMRLVSRGGHTPLDTMERAQAYLAARTRRTRHAPRDVLSQASPDAIPHAEREEYKEDKEDMKRPIVEAVRNEYGEDRTFAIPILMNCGLAGLVDWDDIPGLPFELAAFPHSWYKALRLHVVSYALPALIAIGLLLERRHKPAGILRRVLRGAVRPRVLEKLRQIQPAQGGFLEAAPLTSFVAMAMIALYGPGQPVAAECLGFLRRTQRAEGAWPIDTNLSVWLTTAAVTALAEAGKLNAIDRGRTAGWIAARQHRVRHPSTQAEPGGWAWTHLPGGIPDVDDTSGAILALRALGHGEGIAAGVKWLLAMQNGDGGWPTFCRGWGKLPFDRSSPDLTAHALRAIGPEPEGDRAKRAIGRGLRYLDRVQQADGSWIPLWFGNQGAPDQTNPVLGTSRVLRALETLDRGRASAARGVEYLLRAQNADGGWGGAVAVASSVEETALAVAALAGWTETPATRAALARGVGYLRAAAGGTSGPAAPIGLYFAHLWYSELLYPQIWTLEALGRAAAFGGPTLPTSPT
jgi:squalene-hopene/tetraprenyl-beta-curcumene cyclase